jgi:nucleotide-binding universal stress UspA family protein
MITPRNVLVATDFSESSDAALLYGREFAARFGATLHVLHAAPYLSYAMLGAENYTPAIDDLQVQVEETARKRLDELLIDSDKSGPAAVAAVVRGAVPAVTIIEYAKAHEVDLIVIGTHGRGPIAHFFMGSVAERVVRTAPCPVLTVRHPEHEFVVPDTLATVAHAV